ncbi:MAG: hypothetical protein ABIS50_22030 [Luteolibacter sp.]|uniref:hypothetical protein n=1 Tax=Luteolibacter sp. TaxID=1962973 RepID=UPI00326782D4
MKSISRRILAAFLLLAGLARGETVLQYFNTSWAEISRRIPEVAEAGYDSLWLPNPCKGASGAYSVGYDPVDRFDLGDKDQSGSVATRYGTKAELLRLVEMAHRFGIRVYFDNVMAHSAGPLDPVPAGTLLPGIPGFVPEDFHLVSKTGGGWRKPSDSVDYNDEWQVLNRNPFAWDIAQESPNTSFDPIGQTENADYPKWVGIRHPGKTSLYPDNDLAGVTDANGEIIHPFADKEPYQDTGTVAHPEWAGNGKFDFTDTNSNGQHDTGEPSEPFTDTGVDASNPARQTAAWGFGDGIRNMGDPVEEDVNAMLIRSMRWTIDQTHCDGFRLDAVKHVPSYFFGQQSGTKDPSSAGYLGRAQAQFNLTHGYSDWSNHRDSNFSTNAVRNDLVFFGEHLGAPPNPNDYLAAGMRIANDDFVNNVGGFAGIGSSMAGLDNPGQFTFGVDGGMMYCLSHDNNYMAGSERAAAHQYMLTRAGMPIVYTDGYNISGGPDYFPKPAYIPFLGQFGQNYITGTLPVRRDFIRGDQVARWSTQNFCAWEMRDFSENAGMSVGDATTLLVMHARNYTSGQQMPFGTVFGAGSRLKNYSPYNGSFYATVGNDGLLRGDDNSVVIVPSGGYFAFSYDTPGLPNIWQGSPSVRAIDIAENGAPVPTIGVLRKDGANGDPGYAYTAQVPLVRNPANLTFTARADGSAENILMALDGGMDLNSQLGAGFAAGRDNPPGTARDTYLGFEQMEFSRRVAEKFAAQDVGRNVIGSQGSETWKATIGTGFDVASPALGAGVNTNTSTAAYVYHNPASNRDGATTTAQFTPQPAAAAGQAITVRVKTAYQFQVNQTWLYYTTDGSAPEGSAGVPAGTTQAVSMAFESAGADDSPTLHTDWWKGTIPPLASGTVLRYKIGSLHTVSASRFPFSVADVEVKKRMETVFQITNFNAATATVFPHDDLGERRTGLSEGFHVLRTRAFLSRGGKAALYKTNTQTFYYDTVAPTGQIAFPAENSTLGGTTYGFVVLTDASVTDVRFNILDSNSGNDSPANGNGSGNWAVATEVTPGQLGNSSYQREWRFDYKNIPTTAPPATVSVRLREASSSTNDALSDGAGWFSTLTRHVNTGSPYPVNFRIQFPTADGTVVGTNYTEKVYFDKSLGYNTNTPIDPAQIIGEFGITLDGMLLPRSGYTFIRDETGGESAIAFHLPPFYTGNPDDLHEIRATHQRGDVSLTDTRLVKASPGAIPDSDGDGLPDYWEIRNRLDPNNPDGEEGGSGDKDGDGVSNLLEFLGDYNPADSSDGTLLQPIISPIGGSWRLQFPVIPNRVYQIETSSNLTTWSNTGSNFSVASENPTYLWLDPTPTVAPRFYRVKLSLP